MGWIHDTGYLPAYKHEGFPASVLVDHSLAADMTDIPDPAAVIGWKAACACGWRSPSVHMRTAFPSPTGDPPAVVTGEATRTGAWAEWRRHLFTALPALILADVVSISLPPGTDVLIHPVVAAVVDIVRGRGASWATIAEAARVTTREARVAWALLPPAQRSAPRRSVPVRSAGGARGHRASSSGPRPAAAGEAGRGCAR